MQDGDDVECNDGFESAEVTSTVWQYRQGESTNVAASRWLRCVCQNECVGDAALERRIAACLSEVKLENERKLQQLECKFQREKRQLLVAQEQRRAAHLECALRRLSQLELAQMRSFCQRRCELVTSRVRSEIDSIRRVRLAKRDALCRRQKSELKRRAKHVVGMREASRSATVLSLGDVREVRDARDAQRDVRALQQFELREFDGNTEKLVADFEAVAAEKLRNLMDLRDLQFNHLRCVADRKLDALRVQHCERLRVLNGRLDDEDLQQEACFCAHQSSLPLIFNAQKVDWSTLTWKIKGNPRRDASDRRAQPVAQSMSSGFVSRDGSLHRKL